MTAERTGFCPSICPMLLAEWVVQIRASKGHMMLTWTTAPVQGLVSSAAWAAVGGLAEELQNGTISLIFSAQISEGDSKVVRFHM